jgi:pyruvate kinase
MALKKICAFVVMLLLLALPAVPNAVAADAKKPIKIAHILPYTGKGADWGKKGRITADAIGWAARSVAGLLDVAAMVAYTSSGSSALRMARERPRASILGMPPSRATARRLALVWGVTPVLCKDVMNVSDMTELAVDTAVQLGFAQPGQTLVIAAGLPFGTAGTTNLLRIAQID